MTVLTAPPAPAPVPVPVVLALCDDDAGADGEFDLRRRLAAVLAASPVRVVLDLAACRYLDAPGLRVLLEAREQAAAQGTRLALEHCAPDVLRLLMAAGHPLDDWDRGTS